MSAGYLWRAAVEPGGDGRPRWPRRNTGLRAHSRRDVPFNSLDLLRPARGRAQAPAGRRARLTRSPSEAKPGARSSARLVSVTVSAPAVTPCGSRAVRGPPHPRPRPKPPKSGRRPKPKPPAPPPRPNPPPPPAPQPPPPRHRHRRRPTPPPPPPPPPPVAVRETRPGRGLRRQEPPATPAPPASRSPRRGRAGSARRRRRARAPPRASSRTTVPAAAETAEAGRRGRASRPP